MLQQSQLAKVSDWVVDIALLAPSNSLKRENYTKRLFCMVLTAHGRN